MTTATEVRLGAPSRRPAFSRVAWLAGGLLAAIPVAVTLFWTGLNHDVRFVLGCLRTSDVGPAGVFVHRPLAYRLVLAPTNLVSSETLIRLGALVIVALVALWLRAALRRPESSLVAAAVGLALALSPNWDFLQPEWMAGVFATAAVAASLWPKRLWVGAVLGGLGLALAVLVKYTTAPTALLAIGVVLLVDRRRALWTTVAAVPIGLGLFGLAVLIEPREWRWFHEFSVLNGASPLSGGKIDVFDLARTVMNEALQNPLFALLPVSVVVLLRLRRGWWVLLLALGVLGVFTTTLLQAQWFQYHLTPLLPLAAGVWALAVGRWYTEHGRPPWTLVVTTAILAVIEPLAAARSEQWRDNHQILAYAGLTGLVVLACVVAALESTRGSRRLFAIPVLVAVAALSVQVWPSSPYSFDFGAADNRNTDRVNTAERLVTQLGQVREQIGPDTEVLYIAFGDVAYFLGNPTPCRYPSPVFLQRSTDIPAIRGLVSYEENAACLTDPKVRYLVYNTSWLDLDKLEPRLAQEVRETFDCSNPIRTTDVEVCPRRQ
ncbi:hypothetical protein FHX82_000441 [Amycolatopsis bartoniae]|uniref:Uncharacterized protein n=1 Tax=Amycolatopsis bartoniae TaxID=941986 RepID=A0A8H9M5T5_9PSEU|nr:hypothetical protein [Amycolatopsis bartoniae]MBB2933421.1 hypothetical protein [Amycolatopsis bartoniae]TVT06614.1 hypothetical protein FNH07_19340 [Amycolatopsis bartoniae]GHF59315.1 hypothetical protein GCM10017566_36050 [Amycolatopsis bartoniae]